MKECYQCEKQVHWLAPDSRCGDCTRLSPEQITGEEPMPDEAEQALEDFCNKYGLELKDFDEEDMDIKVGSYKGKDIQLNILYVEDEGSIAYDLFISGISVAYAIVTEDKELLDFITLANQAMSKLD